jgi:hypothetical protein
MDLDQHEEDGLDLQQLQLQFSNVALEEMDYIKTRLSKLRAAQHRRELRQLGTAAPPRRLQLLDGPATGGAKGGDDGQHLEGDFAYGGDCYGDDDDDHDNDGGYGGMEEEDNNVVDGNFNNNTGVASVLDALPQRTDASVSSSSEQQGHTAATFDELCRAHIQAFAKSAQRFATETKLTQRVSAWQAKLFPLLQEEETRPSFDIYSYSDQVISAMQHELDKDDFVTSKDNKLKTESSGVEVRKLCVCFVWSCAVYLRPTGNLIFSILFAC